MIFSPAARLRYWLWGLIPQRLFGGLQGWLARTCWPAPLLRAGIAIYAFLWRIPLEDFEAPPQGYSCFQEFFTRKLAPGVRPFAQDAQDQQGSLRSPKSEQFQAPPLAQGDSHKAPWSHELGPQGSWSQESWIVPSDGRISGWGELHQGQLLQVKGHAYAVSSLLGAPELAVEQDAASFQEGRFAIFHLGPGDYHRFHAPCSARIRRFIHIPGDSWSVAPTALRCVPFLFARNERIVTFLETPAGVAALIAVGALGVGGIRHVYHDLRAPLRGCPPRMEVLPKPYEIRRGEELGRFELGSSLVLLCPPRLLDWEPLQIGMPVRMGQRLGGFVSAGATRTRTRTAT